MRILGDGTQSSERLIGLRPRSKLLLDRSHNCRQSWKVAIVQAKTPRQFPDSLDWIQIRAIRRQVTQGEFRALLRPPIGVKLGMVIPGVIRNHDHSAFGSAAALTQFTKKAPGGHCIEAGEFAAEEKLTVTQTDGSEVANALASRMVENDRVVHLGWNPHSGTGAVLLKMNFIDSPQINRRVPRQYAEFFYARLALADRLEQLRVAVCGGESPIGEIVADIDAPSALPRTSAPDSVREFCHPKHHHLQLRPRADSGARRFQPWPVEPDLSAKAAPSVLPRSSQPNRIFQNDAPNSPPSEAHRPAHRRLHGN